MRGSPTKHRMMNSGLRDHPRACGAHFENGQHTMDLTWIIPAHAGLTAVFSATCVSFRDHPRACGAHCRTYVLPPGTRGSSPRMRGSQKDMLLGSSLIGIIPAHAGLTCFTKESHRPYEDHPRACGAHSATSDFKSPKTGSSPRMRGSPPPRLSSAVKIGIIPAHAGLTRCGTLLLHCRRDHPRACGAHSMTGYLL